MEPIRFTRDDFRDLAQAARASAEIARGDAEKQSNPSTRAIFEAAERRYRDLAVRCDLVASGRNPALKR